MDDFCDLRKNSHFKLTPFVDNLSYVCETKLWKNTGIAKIGKPIKGLNLLPPSVPPSPQFLVKIKHTFKRAASPFESNFLSDVAK